MIPHRTCIGCRRKTSKAELLRLVVDRQGNLELDIDQKKPGRGAYLCYNAACAERALKRRNFDHALKRPVKVAEGFLKEFEEVFKRLSEP